MKCMFILLLLGICSTTTAKPSPQHNIEFYQALASEGLISAHELAYQQFRLQLNQKARDTEQNRGTAIISGTVYESSTAISDVTVWLYDTNRTLIDSTNTSVTGYYEFTALDPGDYYITTYSEVDVYIDAIWSITGTEHCQWCEITPERTIQLSTGEMSTGHDFVLTQGATLTGRMVDGSTGDPVDTLNIALSRPGDIFFRWNVSAQFDGSGNYTVTGIPGGIYRIYLKPEYYDNLHIPEIFNNIQCNLCASMAYDGMGSPVTLSNGSTRSGIDFFLERGAQIQGYLIDATSLNPLDEFGYVMIFNETNQYIQGYTVRGTSEDPLADGAYSIGGLLPGTYFAQGGDAGNGFYVRELYAGNACPYTGCSRGDGGTPITLGPAEIRGGINFSLEYGGKISGQISDAVSGLPISADNQMVQFYDSAGEVVGGAHVNQATGEYTSARAMPAGIYSARTGNMFHGEFIPGYIMEKYNPTGNIDCPGVACDLTSGNITVTSYNPSSGSPDPEGDATATGIDFALDLGFSFSGIINDLSTSSPLADVHVLVYDNIGRFAHWATTNSDGEFTVRGLPAGTYYAKTNNGSNLPFPGKNFDVTGTWIDILYDGRSCPGSACDVTTGDPIIIGSSPDNGLKGDIGYTFNLPDGGTFAGRLLHSETSAGVPNTLVKVYNSQAEFYGSYESDIDGYWMTSGFPTDSYYLVTQGSGGMVDVKYGGGYCFNGQCDPLTAQAVVLGGTYNISGLNMTLKPDYIFRAGMD
ncbi:hypothetical protein GCM10011365_07960 [Marinicella pacifica]|uniref:SD-repeat containing protein B domain-containing protein n=1 Tax=Marinicella pacifica TaxID=1171543 RepID=A0A917CI50_9GAMM|nr:SdrD B-like domain-containing protein [Marinicella pacifica]GGF89142.1 hypothetical protein GCM10011365_07960 [Marinicella pacifica]